MLLGRVGVVESRNFVLFGKKCIKDIKAADPRQKPGYHPIEVTSVHQKV